MPRTNEARHIESHKTCKYKCRLNASVCDNKQRQNNDKCRGESKELIKKKYVIKDLFGILVIVNLNMTNHVVLENIQIMKIVNVEKSQLIS